MKLLKLKSRSEMDLTTGNLFWKVPLFSVPLAFTTILQLLYTTIDLWTVSNYGGGTDSMSAIGSNSPLINMIITIFVSLSIGANVALANAKGANNKAYGTKILHTAILLAVISGVLVGIFGFFASPLLLQWMETPTDIISSATDYLKIYFLGLPFLMLYNYGSQILRALGDSQRPFFVLMISGIINFGFDLLFVIVFQMDVIGVALATIISEAVSALLVLLWLHYYRKGFVSLSFKSLRIDKQALIDILKVGLPSGLQGFGFCFPNVMIQKSLYQITNYTIGGVAISVDEVVAGAAASAQIENYIFAFLDSFNAGCTAFVSQNLGAKKKENISRSFWYCLIWCILPYLIGFILYLTMADQLLGIFITESEKINTANALAAGRERLFIWTSTYILDGIMGVFCGYCRGLKHAGKSAAITITGCVGIRLIFIWFLFPLPYFHTISWLYAVFPISWILVNLVFIPVSLYVRKKTFEKIDSELSRSEMVELEGS